ncbi:cell wall hydrolase [Novosphingobium pentaromativorans]|uniref:Cell wall hydrolase, SleB n=1 Tax=Novosphingobium pentaromativorans US6-1 TaxID=1088721 RepID=G6EBG1_9SPHN|nr:cell wall hydrolase [Novosphingobium pentaromativorans]AIT80392.1 hydrolase [Novosphingobium pentaromativorans US6-1]EHJ61356.1 cell wall hydrolase, SleB [Novosphingobium pentaromativorans US6-1]
MRTKLQWASAVALAATVFTALFSAQGSGAATSDIVPILAKPEPQVSFVSEPVVQALPSEDDGIVTDDDGDDQVIAADTLAQLVAEQGMPDAIGKQLRCLAGAIYFESRGESLEGQLAVGRVIINRAKSDRFPDNFCDVVFQRSQFSFVRGSRMPKIREQSKDWRRALAIATIAIDGSWKSPAKGALFFHAARVSPNWRLKRLAQVDNHIFYR